MPESTTVGSDQQTGQAREQVEQVAQQATEKGREAAQQARSRVRDEVDTRSTEAGEQLRTQAEDIRTVSDELRKQGKEQPAKLAEQAAGRVEDLGSYLRDKDGEALLRDVEDFGRRQPLAVAAGGLVLGFMASRFLKASSRDRYHGTTRPQSPPRTPAAGNGAGI